MRFSQIKLPSNRNFGIFFTGVFSLAAVYFWYFDSKTVSYIFSVLAILFFSVAILKSSLLLPLNKAWMWFGFILGMIVSPIILGLLFFLLFTPIALFIRVKGRDELRLKLIKKNSHWIMRQTATQSVSFKVQF